MDNLFWCFLTRFLDYHCGVHCSAHILSMHILVHVRGNLKLRPFFSLHRNIIIKGFWCLMLYKFNWFSTQGAKCFTSFVESFLILLCSLLAIGFSTQPKTIPTRILFLSICATGALVYWSYSAALISFLTVEKYEYPVKSLEASKSSYKRYKMEATIDVL